MDSWRYDSGDKVFVPNNNNNNNILPPPNTIVRPKNSLLGWELKTQPGFSNDILESQVSKEMGFPEMLGKHQLSNNDPLGCILNDPNSFSGGEDSASKLSNSVVESNSRDFLIDLKLGKVGEQKDATESSFSKGIPLLCSSVSSTTPKRVRTSGVKSQASYCQVYGCNKDLSACKDYHKRHKVCEIHSKTSLVLVNGIEQRFCQQCSSCRKRLAGHNERRRKPQMGTHFGKGRRLLQSFNDSRSQVSMLTEASSNLWKPTKFQVGNDIRHMTALPITNGDSHSKPLLPSYAENQYPALNETGGSVICENNSLYPPALGDAYSSGGPPRSSSYQDTFFGSEDFNNVFDTASTIRGLSSGVTDSGCALSLLSSQSQNSSAILMGRPVGTPGGHGHHYSLSHASDRKIMGLSSQASTGSFGPVLILENNDIVNLEITDGIFHGSDVMNMKAREDGPTIDLLQLSSQLHRVEHQRQSLQVKQENDPFCTLRIT